MRHRSQRSLLLEPKLSRMRIIVIIMQSPPANAIATIVICFNYVAAAVLACT